MTLNQVLEERILVYLLDKYALNAYEVPDGVQGCETEKWAKQNPPLELRYHRLSANK